MYSVRFRWETISSRNQAALVYKIRVGRITICLSSTEILESRVISPMGTVRPLMQRSRQETHENFVLRLEMFRVEDKEVVEDQGADTCRVKSSYDCCW